MFTDLIPLAGIIAGILLVGFAFGKITDLIRLWMEQRHDRKYGDSEIIEKLIRAYKDTDRRLKNLEAIIADDDMESLAATKNPDKTIEISDSDPDEQNAEENTHTNMRNMLK